jgi:tripartite-type tricarboxylate transporter receptor subunit TctC
MTRKITRRNVVLASAALWGMSAGQSLAQPAFPSAKPIRLVTPLPAGSATDAVARTVSRAAAEILGQQIIVDNKAGADGAIAALEVMRAPPDGYTLLLGTNSPLSVVPAMKKVPPYDPNTDFTPITDVGRFTLFLVVNSELPVRSLRELISYAKANPGKLSYASGNTAGFVSFAQIRALAGLDMVHVPYKGEPAAMTDLISNRVQLMFSNLTTAMPHIRSGKLRPITLTLSTRSPLLPDVPTVAESGLQGFSIVSWNALFGPAGMPRDVVDRLNRAFAEAIARPEVIETLAKQGIPIKSSTPEELAALVRAQLQSYTQVMRASGMEPE